MLKLNKSKPSTNTEVAIQNLVPAYLFTRLLAAFFVVIMILAAVSIQFMADRYILSDAQATIAKLEYSNMQTEIALASLKTEHKELKTNYTIVKTKFDNALIKEATVGEAFSVHVSQPVTNSVKVGYQKVKAAITNG